MLSKKIIHKLNERYEEFIILQKKMKSNKRKCIEQINKSDELEINSKYKETININDSNKLYCDCVFDSQIAYLVKKMDENPINSITIIEYLQNKDLQKKVNNSELFLVCKKKNELIKYESEIRKSHFRHKNMSDNPMSEWHKNWQECFELTEVIIGNRRADAVVKKNVLEFQYSRISTVDIDNRTKNYDNYNVYWIIECDDTIKVDETSNGTYIITFEKDKWKYKNFINQQYIYLDNKNRIFRINPQNIKCDMIEVGKYKVNDDFIDYLNDDNIKWEENPIEQGIIYYNQRGAGCGKTYESIQLLQKEKKFAHKEIFIYLTKMHSAKDVILKEFQDQHNRGDLDNLVFDEQDDNNAFLNEKNKNSHINKGINKQYKLSFLNKITSKNAQIIIGTIDSFCYAIGNKKVKEADYFRGIVKSIREGYVSVTNDGTIKYAQQNSKLNKKCLVIIDEAQDLGPDYIQAFDMIIKKTGIDTYVIGDKLQSIWGIINMYTFLENNNLGTTIEKNIGKNEVKRFHNVQFKDFVNRMIDFKKYDLSPIENICDKKCKYKHEDGKKPFEILQIPEIYTNDSDDIKVNRTIEKIIKYMDNEINEYNYLPKNFMFIFPFLKKNYLANQLEARLQDFWIKKFGNKEYQKNVLSKNDFWKEKMNTNKFHKYVYLHKSEERQPINIRESENATRMLSIHSSKGNGCEVVFLLGISEYTLTRFSGQKCNIVYDSLLHVAITRQKKSLYIGLVNNGDEIWNRFNNHFNIIEDINLRPRIENITKTIRFSNVIDDLVKNDNTYNNIYKLIIKPNECEKKLSHKEINNNNIIIDWGHHIVRYCMFFYNIMKNIVENENMEENDEQKSQFLKVLSKISNLQINYYIYENYYKKLDEINTLNKKHKKNTEIPILLYGTTEKTIYHKYCNILKDFMCDIQIKLNKNLKNNKLPSLCALETMILLHMVDIMDHSKYAEILVTDIYSVMYCYDECSNEINDNHPNECLCRKKFTESNDSNNMDSYAEIRKSINKHYQKIEQINLIYNNYHKYMVKKYKSIKFIYNINQPVSFKNNTTNFRLFDCYKILAYSEEYVIHFIIKPQFNKLNFAEIMINAIFNNVMLNKCDDSEKRYQGKKIITCVLTLDLYEPVFYEFDTDTLNNMIISYVNDFLFRKYESYHTILYNFYSYCLKNKPNDKNSIDYICDELDKCQLQTFHRLPGYILYYFNTIKKDVNNANKKNKPIKNILTRVNDKNIFLNKINEDLKDTINEYLNIKNDEINNDY